MDGITEYKNNTLGKFCSIHKFVEKHRDGKTVLATPEIQKAAKSVFESLIFKVGEFKGLINREINEIIFEVILKPTRGLESTDTVTDFDLINRIREYIVSEEDLFKIDEDRITWPIVFNKIERKVQILRDEMKSKALPCDYPHLEETAHRILQYTDPLNLANKFFEIQPFFYNKAKLWWLWNRKLRMWEIIDEIDLFNSIDRALRSGFTCSSKTKAEILEAMKRVGRARQPKPIKNTMIQFMDTIYDFETGAVIKATPNLFATNPIPHKLGESDETPNFDRVFMEWVGKEYVQTLYEILAYCMIPDYPLHRIFCLVGSGMNGKGKFLEIISRFIGCNNKTSTELDYLMNSRFEAAKLYKKLVCLMGETNFSELSKTSLLKRLSGGDTIGFEFKNKDPFDDYNYAKIIIATNSLPTTTDRTKGFYRRWLIIDFPNQFTEKKDILTGIPNWEYENLARKLIGLLRDLMVRREFTNEGTIEERMQRYEERSNPVAQFIKEMCIVDPNTKTPFFQFHERLMDFIIDKGFRRMSKKETGRFVRNEGYDTGYDHVTVEGRDGKKKDTKWMFIYGLCINQKDILNHYFESGSDGSDGSVNLPYQPYRELSGGLPSMDSITSEDIQKSQPVDTIYMKCSTCGEYPSHAYDLKGKPFCKDCMTSLKGIGFDFQVQTEKI